MINYVLRFENSIDFVKNGYGAKSIVLSHKSTYNSLVEAVNAICFTQEYMDGIYTISEQECDENENIITEKDFFQIRYGNKV